VTRRAFAIGAVAAVLFCLGAPGANAHALVRQSSPASGSVVQTAPKQIEITFTEPPELDLTTVHVLDSTGKTHETGPPKLFPGSKLEVEVPVGSLTDGVYTVTWRTVSAADGHVTAGSFSFGVGVSSVSGAKPPPGVVAGSTNPTPSVLDAIGRWAFYWGLAILLAAGVVGLLAFDGRLPGSRWILAGAWLVAAASLVAMIASERSAVGVSLGQLFQTTPGKELIRQALGLVVTASAVVVAMLLPGRLALWFVTLATAATMYLHALAGHASASAHYAWFDVPVQWLHFVAAGVWIGGLAWLLVGTRGREPAERADPVRRFSWLAGIAIVTVAGTGLLRMISEVGGPASWGRVVTASFGVTVLIKIVLFVGLAILGARNRYINVPGVVESGQRIGSLRRTVTAELLIAAGIFGATGVLTQLPPATSIAAQQTASTSAPAHVVATGHDFATSVRAHLTVTPGTVGPNRFDASVVDYDTGEPVDATEVSLAFSLPDHPELGNPTIQLRKQGSDWVANDTVLSMYGRWDATMTVQEPAGGVTVPLAVQTRLPQQQTSVSVGTGDQPTVTTVQLANGGTMQGYLDRKTAGPNSAHYTFFTSAGDELAIASAQGSIITPSGEVRSVKLLRLSKGHFVANVNLTPGKWTFLIDATPKGEGASGMSAYYTQTIGG
jgi:copper transport protein